MTLFDIPTRTNTKDNDLAIARKSKTNKSTTTVKRSGIISMLADARKIVDDKLGKYKNEYFVIRDLNTLIAYLRESSNNGVIAIDTETTGLNPISDKLVGLCLYTPTSKACYIPINHVSYITGERVDNQLTEQDIKTAFESLAKDTKVIMFNAQFDIRVLRNQCNVYLTCYWDCYIAMRCLNENEKDNSLKKLHQKFVLKNAEDEFRFDELFHGITFDKVPIDTAYVYAAHDAIITYELFKFQEPFLSLEQDREDLRKVAWVFRNIEMPIVDVVCNMEDTGVCLDAEYTKELSKKYNSLLEQKLQVVNNEIKNYDELIKQYLSTHKDAKIDLNVNIASTTQLAILLYDILKIPVVDETKPRGTGKEILSKMEHPLAKLILEYRTLSKLVSTYIDKLPNEVNPKTGRIHCEFNQYGADTGRFSSSDPNLQNIPSHNKDIRKMFKATDGYVMMSSDFSQQEQLEYFIVDRWCEVETPSGFVYASQIKPNSVLKVQEDNVYLEIIVKKIETLVDKSQIIFYY